MTIAPAAGIVRYGQASLSDVLPSALAALGVDGEPNVLGIAPAECVVVLLIDGLGWQPLREHAGLAPFLSSLAAQPLTAGFPTTTAVSVTSLGTGMPPGQHGITGYITRADGLGEPANWLTWRGARSGVDLLGDQPPEQVQPVATAFERAEQAGVGATVVSAPAFKESGLTRAALRGAPYLRAFTAADSAAQVGATARTRGGLIYCYNPELDLMGHVYGCGSDAWKTQLQLIDRAVELLAGGLPAGVRLLVTADHGMVNVPEEAKIDYDDTPSLQDGIELLAGEARVRYLHVAPGALEAVRSRWLDVVGDRMAVLTRDEVIGYGWFGPNVSEAARHRIGDLIAVSVSELSVVRRKAESRNASLIGHHGALTDAELLVPLLSS